MTRPNTSTTLDKHSLNTHTQRHVILRFISLLLRGAYWGCGDSQNNRFFPQCHPGLQAHYTDWSIQPNLIHNTQDPWFVFECVRACVAAWLRTPMCAGEKRVWPFIVVPLSEGAITGNHNSIKRAGCIQ